MKTRLAVYTELKTLHSLFDRSSKQLPVQLYALIEDSIKELPNNELNAIIVARSHIEQWNQSFPESAQERMVLGLPKYTNDLKESVDCAIKLLEPNLGDES